MAASSAIVVLLPTFSRETARAATSDRAGRVSMNARFPKLRLNHQHPQKQNLSRKK